MSQNESFEKHTSLEGFLGPVTVFSGYTTWFNPHSDRTGSPGAQSQGSREPAVRPLSDLGPTLPLAEWGVLSVDGQVTHLPPGT